MKEDYVRHNDKENDLINRMSFLIDFCLYNDWKLTDLCSLIDGLPLKPTKKETMLYMAATSFAAAQAILLTRQNKN